MSLQNDRRLMKKGSKTMNVAIGMLLGAHSMHMVFMAKSPRGMPERCSSVFIFIHHRMYDTNCCHCDMLVLSSCFWTQTERHTIHMWHYDNHKSIVLNFKVRAKEIIETIHLKYICGEFFWHCDKFLHELQNIQLAHTIWNRFFLFFCFCLFINVSISHSHLITYLLRWLMPPTLYEKSAW